MAKHGENENKLLAHITGLTQWGKKECKASNRYFGKVLDLKVAQVNNLLRKLKNKNLITVKTSKLISDKTNNKLYKTRKIYLTNMNNTELINKAKNILEEYFRNKYFKSTEYDLEKQEQYEEECYREYCRLEREEYQTKMTAEDSKIIKATLEQEEFERNNNFIEILAQERIAFIWPHERIKELIGKNNIEKLFYAFILFNREQYLKNKELELHELLSPPPYDNISVEKGEYYVELHLDLPNVKTISRKVKLLDYMPWSKDSEEYISFIRGFEKKDELTQKSKISR